MAELPHENIVTEDVLNASRMNEDINGSPEKDTYNNHQGDERKSSIK